MRSIILAAITLASCGQPQYSTVASARAIDGDTLDIAGERIRLNGIDAPEMPGHCRRGRVCAPGDPYEAKRELGYLVGWRSPQIVVTRLKTDRYGRTVAQVEANGVDVSCEMLRRGHAQYVAKWDEGGRTARACGLVIDEAPR